MNPRTVGVAAGIALAVAALDHLTGYETRFEILYLAPVWLLAKPGQQRWAVIMAIVVAALWIAVDMESGHVYQTPLARYWNIVELLAAALAVASLGARRLPMPLVAHTAAPDSPMDPNAAYACAVMRRIEPDGSPRKPGAHKASQIR